MSKKKALGMDPLSWIKSTADAEESAEGIEKSGAVKDAWSAADALPEKSPEKSPEQTPEISLEISGDKTQARLVEEGAEREDATGRAAPKFESFGVKLTVRLSDEQLEYLAALERLIMKSRSPGNRAERITKNSIIRAALNALAKLEIDTSEIGSEAVLENRVEAAAAREAHGQP